MTNAARALADIAASPGRVEDRAHALLDELGRHIPFDASWIALAQPDGGTYTSLASTHLDEATIGYLGGPTMATDIDLTGTDRARPVISASDLPYPVEERETWAECAAPAGFRGGLSVALFAPGRRHVGFLTLLFASPEPPSTALRNALSRLLPRLADGVDPRRSVVAGALLVHGAVAGVVLLPGHRSPEPLPGLPGDDLLAGDSELLVLARAALVEEQVHTSFLWPRGGRHAAKGHVRVTILGCEDGLQSVLSGVVVLSPAGHLRGLTPRELEVLGLVIDGRSNHEIADVLVIAPRTVAAHLEHILSKLRAGSRTLAAVRAERSGLYVPASRSPRG